MIVFIGFINQQITCRSDLAVISSKHGQPKNSCLSMQIVPGIVKNHPIWIDC